jgi:hypothetical protein
MTGRQMGEWKYSSTYSYSGGWLHSCLGSFNPGERAVDSLWIRGCGAQSQSGPVWTMCRRENLFPLLGIKPQFLNMLKINMLIRKCKRLNGLILLVFTESTQPSIIYGQIKSFKVMQLSQINTRIYSRFSVL